MHRLTTTSIGQTLLDDRERRTASQADLPHDVAHGSARRGHRPGWPPDRRSRSRRCRRAGRSTTTSAAGINKTISVSGEDPTNADVVGGALTAGKPAVPWAVFRQQETNGSPPPARPDLRSLVRGRRLDDAGQRHGRRALERQPDCSAARSTSTRNRTARRRRSTSREPGARSPGRPGMRTRREPASPTNNVFASRFDNTGDANQGKWIFGGQSRGTGGGSVPVPSLNIHTDQAAENPSVAGGSAVDPTKPGPWVTWQETTDHAGRTARTRSSSRGRSAPARRTATASRRQA